MTSHTKRYQRRRKGRHTKRHTKGHTKRQRRTPRAGVRTRSQTLAERKSKKAFSFSGMLNDIEELGENEVKALVTAARKVKKTKPFKKVKTKTKKAATIAKKLAQMPVDELTALFRRL